MFSEEKNAFSWGQRLEKEDSFLIFSVRKKEKTSKNPLMPRSFIQRSYTGGRKSDVAEEGALLNQEYDSRFNSTHSLASFNH